MSLQLYAHPFSSYCQKVLIPLYENGTPFELRILDPGHPEHGKAFAEFWLLKRMPLLRDASQTIAEATIIIEHLDIHHRGRTRFLPADAKEALHVRFLDRVFDNYVMTPMQRIVGDFIRKPEERDSRGVSTAHDLLETTYRWLEGMLPDNGWIAGSFGLADCAAAPSLFYADWVHPIDGKFAKLRDYRKRLLAQPSFARAVEEARPYRSFFPPGAPDRD